MRKTSSLLLAALGVVAAAALYLIGKPLEPIDVKKHAEARPARSKPTIQAWPSQSSARATATTPQVQFFDRPGQEPAWAVRYGGEFWRGLSQVQPVANGARPNVAHAIERVRHAFGGDRDPLAVKGSTFAVELDRPGFRFSPFLPGQTPTQQTGVALRMETASITSGGRDLYRANSSPIEWSINGNIAQGLISPENQIVEHYDVRNDGMSVTWVLNERPATAGDVEIRWKHEGLRLGAATATGHHFFDSNGKARVKVGAATAVDSHGRQIPLKTESRGNQLVINVPKSVIESAGYPLAIDPEISSEFELDTPVLTEPDNVFIEVEVSSNGSHLAVIATDTDANTVTGVIVEENGSLVVTKALPLYSGTTSPKDAEIGPNSEGNWLVTWSDTRTGVEQVYGAVIRGDGQIVTEDNGFVITNETESLINRKVASSGNEWLAVWSVNQVIYCMVIGPTGTLELASKKQIGDHINQTMALAGNANGYYAAWRDDLNGGPFDIFGTFVSVDGDATHPSGEPIATLGISAPFVTLASNGTSWLVVWIDGRNGNDDVFARPISETGVLGAEITLTDAANSQGLPAVVSNGDNYLAAWTDPRTGSNDIYGAIISATGTLVTAEDGFVICDATGNQLMGTTIALGSDYFTAWADARNGNLDIYGALISPAGVVQQDDGFVICDAAATQFSVEGAGVGNTALIVWYDLRSGEIAFFGALVDDAATITPADGVAVLGIANTEDNIAMAAADDTWFVAWEDNRNSATTGIDLYGMMVDSTGEPISTNGILIANAMEDQTGPTVDANGSNEFLVAWNTPVTGAPEIHGAVFSDAGAELEADFLVLDPAGADPIERLRVTGYSGDNWLVWCNINGYLNGVIVRPNATRIAMVAPLSPIPANDGDAAGSTEGWLLTFTDTDNDDIKALRFLGDGSSFDLTLCSAAGAQHSPVVTFNGTNWVAAWADNRSANSDIYAATVALDGTITAPDIPICDYQQAQLEPAITAHDDGAFIAWTDYRDTLDGEIYGTFLTTSGVLHNDGFNISGDLEQALSNPRVTSNDDFVLAAWQAGDFYCAARIFPDASVEDLAVTSQEAQLTGISFGRNSDLALVGLQTTNVSGFEQWTGSARAAAQTIEVSQSQSIDFEDVPDQPYTTALIPLTATASSGLPVTFTVVSGPGTINGGALTLTGVGTLILQASQAGDATYDSAASVQQTVTISKRSQSISFPSIGTRNFSQNSFALSASSNRGLTVSFRILSGPARISGNRLTMTGRGTVQVRAFNSGNAVTNAASSTQSFRIVDTTDPRLTTDGSLRTDNGRISLKGKVNDNHIVKKIKYRIQPPDGKFGKWRQLNMNNTIGSKKFAFSVSTPNEGEYLVELYPVDQAGNKGGKKRVKIQRNE